jgi:hypothetical protein
MQGQDGSGRTGGRGDGRLAVIAGSRWWAGGRAGFLFLCIALGTVDVYALHGPHTAGVLGEWLSEGKHELTMFVGTDRLRVRSFMVVRGLTVV